MHQLNLSFRGADMNKFKILIYSLATITAFSANKLPVDIESSFSVGYDKDIVSKKDFENASLGSLVKGDLKIQKLNLGLNLDTYYPIKFANEKIYLGVGAGISGNIAIDISNNFSSIVADKVDINNTEFEKLKENLDEANKEALSKEEEFKRFSTEYSMVYKNVRDVIYKLYSEKKELKKTKGILKEYSDFKETYTNVTEDLEKLKEKREEIANKNKEQKEELRNLMVNLTEYINKQGSRTHKEYETDPEYIDIIDKVKKARSKVDNYLNVENEFDIHIAILENLEENTKKNEDKKNNSEKKISDLEAKKTEILGKYKEKYGEYKEPEIEDKEEDYKKSVNLLERYEDDDFDKPVRDPDEAEEETENNTESGENSESEDNTANEEETSTEEENHSTVSEHIMLRDGEEVMDAASQPSETETNDEENGEATDNENEEDDSELEEDTFAKLNEKVLESEKEKWTEALDKYVELKKEYDEKMARYNNNDAVSKLTNIVSVNKISYSITPYITTKFGYKFNDNLGVMSYLNVGLSISNNRLYTYAKYLESNNVEVDGRDYLIPQNIKNFKLLPSVKLGLGLNYKSFGIYTYTGYKNSGFIGLNLSYKF